MFQSLIDWFDRLGPRLHAAFVEGDRWQGRRSVRIFLVWGPEEEQTAFLSLGGRQITLASGEGDGLRVFHPTDPQLIDWLAEYLENHGTVQGETTSG